MNIKKPNKYVVLAYIIWCTLQLILMMIFYRSPTWECPDIITGMDGDKPIVFFIICCGIPIAIFWIFRAIEAKYYNDEK